MSFWLDSLRNLRNVCVLLAMSLSAMVCSDTGSKRQKVGGSGSTSGIESGQTPAEAETQSSSPSIQKSLTLRYLSFALQDQSPSREDAEAYYSGSKSLDEIRNSWLETPHFQSRLKRYFADLLGVSLNTTPLPGLNLFAIQKNAAGIYRHVDPAFFRKADCDATTAVSTVAWWKDKTETVLVCPSLISTTLSPNGSFQGQNVTLQCGQFSDTGFLHPSCGCGPHMIACVPWEHAFDVRDSIRKAFPERAAYVYKQNLGWFDLIGGDFLVANRWLAWAYLVNTQIIPGSITPSSSQLEALENMSVDTWERIEFPTFPTVAVPSGNVHAGILTSPGYLSAFNTFRSRIRALAEGFLCKDVDATLGTDIKTFLNPQFSNTDKAHAVLPGGCPDCHFPMDNMGSLNFGWSSLGDLIPTQSRSLRGYAFGREGAGPAFLVQSLVQYAPEFHECMAKSAWQSFTGLNWKDLPEERRQALQASSREGPRKLLTSVFEASEFRDARISDNLASSSPDASKRAGLDFQADIKPILDRSCSGQSCHSNGSSHSALADQAVVFISLIDVIKNRIGPSGNMPPSYADKKLENKDREILLKYVIGQP